MPKLLSTGHRSPSCIALRSYDDDQDLGDDHDLGDDQDQNHGEDHLALADTSFLRKMIFHYLFGF